MEKSFLEVNNIFHAHLYNFIHIFVHKLWIKEEKRRNLYGRKRTEMAEIQVGKSFSLYNERK